MADPDKVFKQTYAWYKASIDRVLAASGLSSGTAGAGRAADLADARGAQPGGAAGRTRISRISRTTARRRSRWRSRRRLSPKSLVALGYVQQAVAALGSGGNPAAALAVVGPVLQQIDRLSTLQARQPVPERVLDRQDPADAERRRASRPGRRITRPTSSRHSSARSRPTTSPTRRPRSASSPPDRQHDRSLVHGAELRCGRRLRAAGAAELRRAAEADAHRSAPGSAAASSSTPDRRARSKRRSISRSASSQADRRHQHHARLHRRAPASACSCRSLRPVR